MQATNLFTLSLPTRISGTPSLQPTIENTPPLPIKPVDPLRNHETTTHGQRQPIVCAFEPVKAKHPTYCGVSSLEHQLPTNNIPEDKTEQPEETVLPAVEKEETNRQGDILSQLITRIGEEKKTEEIIGNSSSHNSTTFNDFGCTQLTRPRTPFQTRPRVRYV